MKGLILMAGRFIKYHKTPRFARYFRLKILLINFFDLIDHLEDGITAGLSEREDPWRLFLQRLTEYA